MIVAPLIAVAVALRPDHHEHASRSEQRAPLHAATHEAPAGRLLTITMYCYTGSRNAAGQWPTVGTAAANAYPLGAQLHVAGIGDVVVEDRSAPGATDVDLYGGSDSGCEARAIAWGRRTLLVTEVAA